MKRPSTQAASFNLPRLMTLPAKLWDGKVVVLILVSALDPTASAIGAPRRRAAITNEHRR